MLLERTGLSLVSGSYISHAIRDLRIGLHRGI